MTVPQAGPRPVARSITVAVPIQRAWDVFTRDFATWWPTTHHIGTEPMDTCLMEPRTGGRWYEVGADGSECDWGVVLAWEPKFTPDGPNATRVDLEHRGFEWHWGDASEMRAVVGGEGGWNGILARFRGQAEAS
jgi:hypothetical protein